MKTKILAAILILSLSTGCNLDLEPKGDANGEQVWKTALGNEQMLSGTYSRLRKILIQERPLYICGDLPSSALLTHGHWILKDIYSEGNFTGSYIPDYWADWSPYFQVITTATTILKHINDVPLSDFDRNEAEALKKRNRIRGEAYFLYAYTYFYMVRIYGDLPLVKESFENAEQGLENGSTIGRKQSPEKEILEYLIKNIDVKHIRVTKKQRLNKRRMKGATINTMPCDIEFVSLNSA